MKKLALVQDWSSPYKSKNNDSMEEYYEAYRTDSSGIIEQNGEKYFRIIAKCLMKIGEDLYYLVSVDRKIGINPTSVFEDENGNCYKYYTKVLCVL